MHWSEKYIDTPYLYRGRTLEALDCYGLVKVVYKNEFSIELPDFDLPDVESTKMTEKAFEDSHMLGIWFRAAFPKEGDVIEINIGGHPIHCGIVVSPNSMLHILGGYTARIERYDSTRWSSRINGIYRHKDKCCA